MKRWRLHLLGLLLLALGGIAWLVVNWLGEVTRERLAIVFVIEIALLTGQWALVDAVRNLRDKKFWRALHAATIADVTAGLLLFYLFKIMSA